MKKLSYIVFAFYLLIGPAIALYAYDTPLKFRRQAHLSKSVLVPTPAHKVNTTKPKAEDHEPKWSKYLATRFNGVAEFKCIDGSRVDVYNAITAYEVEWASKWKESIGQAVLYRCLTGKKGGVILLVGREDEDKELKYIHRCIIACRDCNLELIFIDVHTGKRK